MGAVETVVAVVKYEPCAAREVCGEHGCTLVHDPGYVTKIYLPASHDRPVAEDIFIAYRKMSLAEIVKKIEEAFPGKRVRLVRKEKDGNPEVFCSGYGTIYEFEVE